MKKQTFILLLVVLALFATVLGVAAEPPGPAATITESTMATSAVTINVPADYATIQAAITAAAPGDTIQVAAGGYLGPITINKSVFLQGPNYKTNIPPVPNVYRPGAGVRVAEATITGTVSITASNVTLRGFTLTNPGGTYAVDASNGLTGINITHNIVYDIGSAGLGSNVHAVRFQDGTDNVLVKYNLFNTIQANNKSISAVFVGDSGASDSTDNIEISANYFKNITSATSGAYGIIFNNAAGVNDAVIRLNIFELLDGGWMHAVGLETATPNALVSRNTFFSLTADGIDKVAVFFEKNSAGGTVTVERNRFLDTTFIGVAQHYNDLPSGAPGGGTGANGLDYTVNAINNWWGDVTGPSNPASIIAPADIPTGSGAGVGAQVTFRPWSNVVSVQPWSQGFEFSTLSWNNYGIGTVARVPSTTDGITSAGGAYHGKITSSGVNSYGPYSFFADASEWFPAGGYTTEVDVYLDPTWPLGTGFEWDVAAWGTDRTHKQDFIFHIVRDTSTQKLLVNATNNSNYKPREDLDTIAGVASYEITTAGWYTLKHIFTNNSGVLSVETRLLDSSGATLWSKTTGSADNLLPAIAAGNGYAWFTSVVPALPIHFDNQEICLGTGPCGPVDPATVTSTPADDLALCGAADTVTLSFSDLAGASGYEFKVSYDKNLVSADGTIDYSFFVPGGYSPGGWAGDCNDATGICQFAVSQIGNNPVFGSGTVGSIELTPLVPVTADSFDLVVYDLIVTEPVDSFPMDVALPATPLEVDVCGQVDVTGNVRLQGRTSPAGTGTVETFTNLGDVHLYDSTGTNLLQTVEFDNSTGNYTFEDVSAFEGGTDFVIEATRALYISNRRPVFTVNPLVANAIPSTRLLGGDANLSANQLVNILDMGCLGGVFGLQEPANLSCGGTGSGDINNDDKVNIQDLAIAGGNYTKFSFLPW